MPPTPAKHEPGRITLRAPAPAPRQSRRCSQSRRVEQRHDRTVNQLRGQPLVRIITPRLLDPAVKVPEGLFGRVKIVARDGGLFHERGEQCGLAHLRGVLWARVACCGRGFVMTSSGWKPRTSVVCSAGIQLNSSHGRFTGELERSAADRRVQMHYAAFWLSELICRPRTGLVTKALLKSGSVLLAFEYETG